MGDPAKPLRLYLVEDSPIMVRLLRELLGEPTLKVVGQSAMAGAAEAEIIALAPDVVIVDIGLENGNGFDVLRALSAQPCETHRSVIVLSNYASQRYRDEAKRLGADYFFDKNGEIVELLKTVLLMAEGATKT